MRRPFYSPLAKDDLREITSYLAARNATAAKRLIQEIRDRCRVLARNRNLGARQSDLGNDIRVSVVWPYVIFYRDIADGIRVERVLHGARDARRLFGLE